MALTAGEIAKRLGAVCEGDAGCEILRIASIRDAVPGDITFVANTRYASAAAKTKASAVVVGKDWDRPCPAALIKVDNPEKAFAQVASLFAPLFIAYALLGL